MASPSDRTPRHPRIRRVQRVVPGGAKRPQTAAFRTVNTKGTSPIPRPAADSKSPGAARFATTPAKAKARPAKATRHSNSSKSRVHRSRFSVRNFQTPTPTVRRSGAARTAAAKVRLLGSRARTPMPRSRVSSGLDSNFSDRARYRDSVQLPFLGKRRHGRRASHIGTPPGMTPSQLECVNLFKSRCEQLQRVLTMVGKSECAQNLALQEVNDRKSRLWKQISALEKLQQSVTDCMCDGGTLAELRLFESDLEPAYARQFVKVIEENAGAGEDRELAPFERLQVWGDFYDRVVLPLVVEHEQEDSLRMKMWRKLAPTVNRRMGLKSTINMLNVMAEQHIQGERRWKNAERLAAYLDKHAPIPCPDKEFAETYL